jgi:3-hydroxymyristoyl/3-hydroxydecanoyl-(acyl carrier protein) dehydratase
LKPPHRFPFELVDREVDDAAHLAPTAGGWWLRGTSDLTLPWIVEATAQAAARILAAPESPAGGRLALAGIDDARLSRAVAAGERCELRVRLAGRWGGLAKVEGEVLADGASIGRLGLLLATPAEGAAVAAPDGASTAPSRRD